MAYFKQTLTTAADSSTKTSIGIPGWAQALIDEGLEQRDAQLAFTKAPQLYRAVTLRANAMAGVPYKLCIGTEESKNHADWPFPQGLHKLLYELEASLLVSGAGYLLKLQPSMGGKRVVGLQYLSPATMQVIYSNNRISFVQNVRGMRYGPWEADRLLYMREFSFSDDVGPGLAPAKVALPAANLRIALSEFATGFFASGGQPLTLLTLAGNPPPTEVERTEAFFKRTMSGVRNAWRILAVRSEVTVTPITPEIQTMAMPELAETATREIAAAFGIPLSLLTSDSANYATAQSDMQMFYENTIKPRLLIYETAFNEQLLHPIGLHLKFHPEEMQIFQTDEAERSGSLKNLVDAGIDLRTAMKILGYAAEDLVDAATPPVEKPEAGITKPVAQPTTDAAPDEDEMSYGKGYAMDTDYSISLQQYAAQAQKKSIDAEFKTWARLAAKDRHRAAEFSCNHVTPEQEAWLKDKLLTTSISPEHLFENASKTLRLISKAERAVAKVVRTAFVGYAGRIREAAAAGKVDNKAVADMLKQLTTNTAPILTDVFFNKLVVASTNGGVPVDREKYKTDAQVWAENHKITLKDELEATTLKDLQQMVADLVQDPRESVANVDEALRLRLFKTLGQYRTTMIAITEVARAKSGAINQLYDDLTEDDEPGQESSVKRWATQIDEKVCSICGPFDDTLQKVWEGSYPEGPPAHPNCRCEIGVERKADATLVPPSPKPIKPKKPKPVVVVPPVVVPPVVPPAVVPPKPKKPPVVVAPVQTNPRKMSGQELHAYIMQQYDTPEGRFYITANREVHRLTFELYAYQQIKLIPKRVGESDAAYQARRDAQVEQGQDLVTALGHATDASKKHKGKIKRQIHDLLRVEDPITWDVAQMFRNTQGQPNGMHPMADLPIAIADGIKFSQSIISKSIKLRVAHYNQTVTTVDVISDPRRSHAKPDQIFIRPTAGIGTTVHELGHVLDHQSSTAVSRQTRLGYDSTWPIHNELATQAEIDNGNFDYFRTGLASYALLRNRSKDGTKNKDLGNAYNSSNMNGEPYREQVNTPFIEPYAAKDYTKWYGSNDRVESEVLAVGMEQLYENPLDLAARDPELFQYVINVIRGTHP